jgi:hypothetical protein
MEKKKQEKHVEEISGFALAMIREDMNPYYKKFKYSKSIQRHEDED